MAKLVYDAELCTGCRACELACSFHCVGEFNPAKSCIRIVKNDEEGIDVPLGCEHCETPMCELVCPVKAFYRDDSIGRAVLHDSNVCIGCLQCLSVCPFGAIHYDAQKKLIYKCDLCNGVPECVKWCFTEAIKYVDEVEDIVSKKARRQAEKVSKAMAETRKYKEL